VLYHSKASSSVLAVDERQSLETLTREEKTASRTLAQLSEKEQGFDEKKTTRTEELHQRNAKREEVGLPVSCLQLKPHIKNEAFFIAGTKNCVPTNGFDEYSTGARQSTG
jgi:hypothetical protein